MKIRSLLLGSAAAAGLATGAYAADPVALTALDICDALGKTGVTVSSDTNCLQLSGEVKYEFSWGDYKPATTLLTSGGGYGTFTVIDNGADAAGRDNDWESNFEAYLKAVATADSEFGPASVAIKIKQRQQRIIVNEANFGANGVMNGLKPANLIQVNGGATAGTGDDVYLTPGANGVFETPVAGLLATGPTPVPPAGSDDTLFTDSAVSVFDDTNIIGGDDTGGVIFDEAYVSVGDSTVITVGKKGTLMNTDDDAPFNWLGLFNSEKVDVGVKWTKDLFPDGGHVIQISSDLGNGLSAGVGLEKLETAGAKAGTLVGVLNYAGEGLTAHVTLVGAGVLDGVVENWGVHAGFTGTFDAFKVRGAIAADNTGYWNALGSAQATFDMFTLAASVEANAASDWGVGGSVGVTVADGVSINLGGRYYQDAGAAPDGWQVAAQLKAAVTETLTLTAEVGDYGNDTGLNAFYGKGILDWAPGGDLTMSVSAEANSIGGYKTTVKGAKKF